MTTQTVAQMRAMAGKTEVSTTQECVEGPYYLEKVSIPLDSVNDYNYEEVLSSEESSVTDGEEDFKAALRAMRNAVEVTGPTNHGVDQETISHIPEVVDDFLRNFLVRMGMNRTFDCFQTEWYEMMQKGLVKTDPVKIVPDAFTHNQLLDNELKNAQRERDDYRNAVFNAGETLVKLQKERDFHRLHHKRVAEEKNRLIEDMGKLRKHCASYEPALKQLNDKYQDALKQKMLISLERDCAFGHAQSLEVALYNAHSSATLCSANRDLSLPHGHKVQCKLKRVKLPNDDLILCGNDNDSSKNTDKKEHLNDSEFPITSRVNPYLSQIKRLAAQDPKVSGFHVTNSLKAHTLPISCLALHPHKFIVASSSDDQLWKLWGVPAGEMIMTGEGHSDWLSSCCFHPNGGSLATTSGDASVRIWDFAQGSCILALDGHTHATWGCSFHSCGDFLASCSMDNTIKVWDLQSERCRNTLRGHTDSVNSVTFLPYSNTLLTCSADKTLSLWDARTALCAQTFYGHQHSCNHATFNAFGDTVASCDSYGVITLWDVRKVAAMVTMDTGPHPSNQVAFSPGGRTLAIASNDGSIKVVELCSSQMSSLLGHSDAVQSVIFDHKGEHLLSAGSDGVMLIWS